MKNIIKLEETAMLGLCIYALLLFHVAWWWWLVLALGPDISMIGYAAGNKVGAALYNIFHHKGLAVVLFITGSLMHDTAMQVMGIVLFGHSSMDRLLGYGLKTGEGFKYTHLGIIGRSKK